MLTIKKYKNIFRLKKHWNIINPNEYSSFDFWRLIWCRSSIYGLPKKSYLIFFEILDDNKPVLIVPLFKKIGKNEFFSMSKFNGTFKFDFIYSNDIEQNRLNVYIDFLIDNIIAKEIAFDKIVQYSKTHIALQQLSNIGFVENDRKAISIIDIHQYDKWYNSLSKNTRQNIRTAYNRLNSDGHSFEFNIYLGEKIYQKQLNKLIDLYCDRHIKRYGLSVSIFKRIYLKYFDFSTIFINKSKKNFYAILEFDGKLAAFMSGIKENNTFRIPRLSIDDEFSRYSPGVILINETIKAISDQEDYKTLDLGIGDEKYKTQMGGVEYHMVNMQLKK